MVAEENKVKEQIKKSMKRIAGAIEAQPIEQIKVHPPRPYANIPIGVFNFLGITTEERDYSWILLEDKETGLRVACIVKRKPKP